MKNKLILTAVVNSIFLLYFLHYFINLNPYLLSVLINLILFIIPGAIWFGAFKKNLNDVIGKILTVLLLSVFISLIGILMHRIFGVVVSSFSQLIFIVVLTNLGILVNDFSLGIKQYKVPLVIFFILYSTAYLVSTRIANRPFADSDLDLQGTSYSLINHLTPRMLTDRKTIYNFSHPLLPAFYSANTILFFDELNGLKYYYDASLDVEKIEKQKPFIGETFSFSFSDNKTKQFKIKAIRNEEIMLDTDIMGEVTFGNLTIVPDRPRSDYINALLGKKNIIDYKWVKEARIWGKIDNCYKKFFNSSFLLSTRASQFMFTALTAMVMFIFIFKLTGSYFFAFFGVLLYMSIPEILISLSSTNYKAVTSFALISAAYLYYFYKDQASLKEARLPLFTAGLFCALSDHKTVILIAAVLIRDCILALKKGKAKHLLMVIFGNYIFMGFISGVAAYWFYGLLISPRVFFRDHFLYHFLNRVIHNNEFGYTGYLSLSQLWITYSGYIGGGLVLLSLWAIIHYLRFIFKEEWPDSLFSIWFIFGAIAFSLVDHRETYHLVYITPALILSTMKFVSAKRIVLKTACIIIFIYVFFTHLWMLSELALRLRGISSIAYWL